VRRAAVVFGCVPAATFLANLAPWWRSEAPGPSLSLAVLGCTVPLAAIALLGPWRSTLLGPAGAVGALTAAVLAADVATGSVLSLTTLMGGQPLTGGRFYGFSNPGFALFGAGALLAAVAAADLLLGHRGRRGRRGRREAVVAVAGIGLVATVVDVAPALGADFGGPPALIPAFAYLALRVAGVRLTWRRAALVGAGTLAALTLACVLDWLRPPQDRSHLGRFVQSVLDGDAGGIVARKAAQNVEILASSPATLALPVAAALLAVALARPARWRLPALETAYEQAPLLRSGLAAIGILVGIGFVLNDSGTAIPPVTATLVLPLLAAVCLRAREQAGAQHGPSAPQPAPPPASGRAPRSAVPPA